MAVLFEQPEQRFIYVHLATAAEFAAPPAGEPFACLLWNAASQVNPDDRAELSRRLIHSGCTYLVAGGIDCEEWHDTADMEFLALGLPESEYERRFLMTTWHANKSMDEVAFYFAQCTFPYPGTGLDEYALFLVLQFGGDQQVGERLKDAVSRQIAWLEDQEPPLFDT